MKTSLPIFIVLLCCVLFLSCEKEPVINPQKPDIRHSDICGTWEWQNPFFQENDYLRIIFNDHSYRVESHYVLYANDTCFTQLSFFYDKEQGNYKIKDGKFYMWNVTPLPNFAEIPFQEDINPLFNVDIQEDTMVLKYLHSLTQSYNYPAEYKLVRVR